MLHLSILIPEKIAIKLKESLESDAENQESNGVPETEMPQLPYACKDNIEITGRPLTKRGLKGLSMKLKQL